MCSQTWRILYKKIVSKIFSCVFLKTMFFKTNINFSPKLTIQLTSILAEIFLRKLFINIRFFYVNSFIYNKFCHFKIKKNFFFSDRYFPHFSTKKNLFYTISVISVYKKIFCFLFHTTPALGNVISIRSRRDEKEFCANCFVV